MGCAQGKQKQKAAKFQYEIYDRAQPYGIQEEKRYDIQKNPIVQRRVKSHSQTPDQQNRTKQYSDLLPSSKPQF
ncbi:unnamed protein product [Paramecium pentaurelia]|uniref:Uncharacterized protein n=1 Tax=Paramecium pentaurelia TaxID=43138 RepID=A0A8S1V4T2_9CILI|nr:unnamed protein product [Paramecium pentaurelia]